MILRTSTLIGATALALALALPGAGAMAQDRKEGGGQSPSMSAPAGNQGNTSKGGSMPRGEGKSGMTSGQVKGPQHTSGDTRRMDRGDRGSKPAVGSSTSRSSTSRGERGDRGDRGDGGHRGRRTSWGGDYLFYFYDGYYHGNCAWLKQRYRETGARYWLRRYEQCRNDD